MYKKLVSSLLIMGTVFSSSPVFSSSYEPLKYPLFASCSRYRCLLNEMVSRNADDRYTVENFDVSGTVLSPSRYYYDYGCDTVPIDVQSPTCPNLVIRGLPFIRNTITCYQKNR